MWLERRDAPVLSHVFTANLPAAASTAAALEDNAESLAARLDALGVPTSAGRDRCRTALKEAGVAYSTAALTEAVRLRKAPDLT